MQARLKQRIESLTSELWFIPAILTGVSLGLSALMLGLDHTLTITQWAKQNPLLATSAEGARSLLATVAGSTISVAGVLFSITILVLSTAARQFGPGLLRNFMHHRGTQVVLGTFVGTFTYALVILRFVDVEHDFVPHLSVNFGMLLGLTSFFLLIYFIHHVATFIQVGRVVDDVAGRMERILQQEFPERQSRAKDAPDDEAHSEIAERADRDGQPVISARAGYLQAVENSQLIALADRHDIIIRLEYRPGHFVLPGAVLAEIMPTDRVEDSVVKQVRNKMMLGTERSESQDPEYAVHQMIQIGVRALSPGINDPYTALSCVNRIGAALALLSKRQLPSRYHYGRDGQLRVIENPLTYAGVVAAAFNQLRQLSAGHLAVVLRMLEVISELAQQELPDAFRDSLHGQLEAIDAQHGHGFQSGLDRREYEKRRDAARAALRRQ